MSLGPCLSSPICWLVLLGLPIATCKVFIEHLKHMEFMCFRCGTGIGLPQRLDAWQHEGWTRMHGSMRAGRVSYSYHCNVVKIYIYKIRLNINVFILNFYHIKSLKKYKYLNSCLFL